MDTTPLRIEFSAPAGPERVAKELRKHLSAKGFSLGTNEAMDLVGRMFGYPAWADLVHAAGGADSPGDLDVGSEEVVARLTQYHAALIAIGVPSEVACETLARVVPTALALAEGPVPDLLRSPQGFPGLDRADAAAFGATPGGARLVDALRACVADDPHWVARGLSRLNRQCDAWLERALETFRDDPSHPSWPALAVLAAAQAATSASPSHPHCGTLAAALRRALPAGDLAAAADALAAAPQEALMSLAAHAEDAMAVQLARLSPSRALLPTVMLTVPSLRTPWRPLTPFSLECQDEPGAPWAREAVEAFGVELDGDAPESLHLRVRGICDGPLVRGDAVLLSDGHGRQLCSVALLHASDPAAGVHRVEVDGPNHIAGEGAPPATALEAYLLAALLHRFDADLARWGRVVPPGGRLELRVASGAGDGTPTRFARQLAHAVGDRYEARQDCLCDLGYDLVVGLDDAAGRAVPLPRLHSVEVPGAARKAWAGLLRAHGALRASGLDCLLASVSPAYAFSDGMANPLDEYEGGEEILAFLDTPHCEEALRAVVAEAGLGSDAVLAVRHDLVAVVSAASLSERDWSRGFGACLVLHGEPGEGAAARAHHRFWSAFPGELETVLGARSALPAGAGATHPGTGAHH